MDASSTMTASAGRTRSSVTDAGTCDRWREPFCSTSFWRSRLNSWRWMVYALRPVASDRRLAALPVGDSSMYATPRCSSRSTAMRILNTGGLADTGATTDDRHLQTERRGDRTTLLGFKLQLVGCLGAVQGLLEHVGLEQGCLN